MLACLCVRSFVCLFVGLLANHKNKQNLQTKTKPNMDGIREEAVKNNRPTLKYRATESGAPQKNGALRFGCTSARRAHAHKYTAQRKRKSNVRLNSPLDRNTHGIHKTTHPTATQNQATSLTQSWPSASCTDKGSASKLIPLTRNFSLHATASAEPPLLRVDNAEMMARTTFTIPRASWASSLRAGVGAPNMPGRARTTRQPTPNSHTHKSAWQLRLDCTSFC